MLGEITQCCDDHLNLTSMPAKPSGARRFEFCGQVRKECRTLNYHGRGLLWSDLSPFNVVYGVNVKVKNELNAASMHCPICSSDRLKRFDANASDAEQATTVHIVECGDCSFAWQYPLGRSELESIKEYDLNYQMQGERLSSYFNPQHKKEIATLELEFVSQLQTEGNQLLDIGAGAGIFAEVAAANGYSVTAIDPALEEERLKSNENIRAIRGTTDSLTKGDLFDIATLWDVIEHVTKPIDTILEARTHLKEGGWLVIETGNYKSVDRVKGYRAHWIYQLDHRWYFSPESMARILRKLGFSEIIYAHKSLRPGSAGNTNYLGPSRAQLLKSIVKAPLKARSHISTFLELKKATNWPFANIGIFALAAKCPPSRQSTN